MIKPLKYIIYITLITLFLLLTNCSVTKPETNYVVKDSLVTKTEIVYKDSIIKIPGDTIRFEIPCNKDTVFIYRSKNSSSLVQVRDGKITVQNNCDEKDLLITKLRYQVEKLKTESRDSIITITKNVKYVPKIYKIFASGFWILLVSTIALVMVNTSIWGIIVSGVVSIVRIITKSKKKEKN